MAWSSQFASFGLKYKTEVRNETGRVTSSSCTPNFVVEDVGKIAINAIK